MNEKKKRTPSRATLLTRAHGRLYRAREALLDLREAKSRNDARFEKRIENQVKEVRAALDALAALKPPPEEASE